MIPNAKIDAFENDPMSVNQFGKKFKTSEDFIKYLTTK